MYLSVLSFLFFLPGPFYWGNMIASIHIKTSIDIALFHLERVGVGQRVDLNLMRCGMYCNLMYVSSMMIVLVSTKYM
jgi:hypothetical protein